MPPVPLSAFSLATTPINRALLSRIHTLWYGNASQIPTHPSEDDLQRWFKGASAEDKRAFDNQCHEVARAPLQSIGPEALQLPPWGGYDEELSRGGWRPLARIFEPLIETAGRAEGEDEEVERPLAALGLVILLDQMPRNIFRDDAGKAMVFTHYDRLARSVVNAMWEKRDKENRGNMSAFSGLLDHDVLRPYPARGMWLLMPLMHSEHLPYHDLFNEKMNGMLEDAKARGDDLAVERLGSVKLAEDKHRPVLEQFGRYMHRNKALGREDTAAEIEYVKNGGPTFG